jgi:hypothetical protein
MGGLLDKLRGAPRASQEPGLLFDALRKAHAERESARQASEAMTAAGDARAQGSEPGSAVEAGIADASPSHSPAGPKRRDTRTAAAIAMLIVAAALCAAVAWRGTIDIAQPSVLKIDPGLDVKRIQPERAQPERAPAGAARKKE